MDNFIFPVAVYPSQLAIFKEKADYLADSIRSHYQIKVSKFKRYDYLAIALGYKSHNDLIKSSEHRKDADKLTPLSIFDERPVIESIAEVFAAKVNGLTKANCIFIICRLASDKSPWQWAIGDYVDLNHLDEPPSSVLNLARSASAQHLPEMVLHGRDYSALDSAERVLFWECWNTGRKRGVRLTITTAVSQEELNNCRNIKTKFDLIGTRFNAISVEVETGQRKFSEEDFLEESRIFTHTLANASEEEAEAIFSNVGARLVMGADETNEACNLFKDRGEIDMTEVIRSNPVTTVNLDSMARSDSGRKVLSQIAQSAKRLQSPEVHKEKKRLTQLLQPEQELSDVCEHKISDHFHNKEIGSKQSKCIVCGHQWVESEFLSKTKFKHWKRISAGKLVGQYKEKEKFYIGTTTGPMHGLMISEVKELMDELRFIKDAGGIVHQNMSTPHHQTQKPSKEFKDMLNERADDLMLLSNNKRKEEVLNSAGSVEIEKLIDAMLPEGESDEFASMCVNRAVRRIRELKALNGKSLDSLTNKEAELYEWCWNEGINENWATKLYTDAPSSVTDVMKEFKEITRLNMYRTKIVIYTSELDISAPTIISDASVFQ